MSDETRDPQEELCGRCGHARYMHTIVGHPAGQCSFTSAPAPKDDPVAFFRQGRVLDPKTCSLEDARMVLAYAEKFRT